MSEDTLSFTINGTRSVEVFPGVHGRFASNAGLMPVGGKTVTVITEYGDMLFQELKGSFGSLWISNYDIKHKAVLSAE